MATQTSNYSLVKPAATEAIDVSQLNGNMDIIDTAMAGLQTGLDALVKFTSQSLTNSQKEQARTNIGAVSATDAVLVNSSQSLNDTQKLTARSNIGAGDAATVANHTEKFNSMFLIRDYTGELSSIASGYLETLDADAFNISDIPGYTPVAVVKYNTGSRYLSPVSIIVRTTGGVFAVRNTNSAALTNITMTISFLFVKTELIGL